MLATVQDENAAPGRLAKERWVGGLGHVLPAGPRRRGVASCYCTMVLPLLLPLILECAVLPFYRTVVMYSPDSTVQLCYALAAGADRKRA